jgi:hypothetical protein
MREAMQAGPDYKRIGRAHLNDVTDVEYRAS